MLADLIEHAEAHAHKTLIERRERQLLPFYHLVTASGESVVIPLPWRSDIEKQLMLLGVKAKAKEIGAVAALFMSESWVSIKRAPTPWHARRVMENLTPPSQDPERREAVFIAATDGADVRGSMLQIVRDKPGGRVLALVKDEKPSSQAEIAGQMIEGIIPRRES